MMYLFLFGSWSPGNADLLRVDTTTTPETWRGCFTIQVYLHLAVVLLTFTRQGMQGLFTLLLLGSVEFVRGHGGGHDGPAAGETIQQYAQRHVCDYLRDTPCIPLILYNRCLQSITCKKA